MNKATEINDESLAATLWTLIKSSPLRQKMIVEIRARGWGKGLSVRTIKRRMQKRVGKIHRPKRIGHCDVNGNKRDWPEPRLWADLI